MKDLIVESNANGGTYRLGVGDMKHNPFGIVRRVGVFGPSKPFIPSTAFNKLERPRSLVRKSISVGGSRLIHEVCTFSPSGRQTLLRLATKTIPLALFLLSKESQSISVLQCDLSHRPGPIRSAPHSNTVSESLREFPLGFKGV